MFLRNNYQFSSLLYGLYYFEFVYVIGTFLCVYFYSDLVSFIVITMLSEAIIIRIFALFWIDWLIFLSFFWFFLIRFVRFSWNVKWATSLHYCQQFAVWIKHIKYTEYININKLQCIATMLILRQLILNFNKNHLWRVRESFIRA